MRYENSLVRKQLQILHMASRPHNVSFILLINIYIYREIVSQGLESVDQIGADTHTGTCYFKLPLYAARIITPPPANPT